jgi:sodium pump decarboxylase gamma subunit
MIFQGLVYMVLGMAVVFAFLILLVLALKIASRIVSVLDRRYPLKEKWAPMPAAAGPDPAPGEGEVIAAALGAVAAYDPSLLQVIPSSITGIAAASPAWSETYPDTYPLGPEGGKIADRRRRTVNPWALSGRQTSMKMRTLMQRGVLKR